MKVVLKPGEKVVVAFDGTDGEVEVEFAEDAIRATADLPDDSGREGIIYEERFAKADRKTKKDSFAFENGRWVDTTSGKPLGTA